MAKRNIDQLHQSVHHLPKSTSNAIYDYYFCEPGIPVQNIDLVLRTPPSRPLEEERCIDPAPRTPPPRPLEEEQQYPEQQHRPPERFIHEKHP